MDNINQRPASKRNFTPGRNGTEITHVVVHTEQGTDAGTASWFANPQAHASAHYTIAFDGSVSQCVQDEDTAWHAGSSEMNHCSIGIELEGFYERARFPGPMMNALVELIQSLVEAHPGIVLDREHVIGHCEVPDPKHPGQVGGLNHHQDPGPNFPWSSLEAQLGMGSDGTGESPDASESDGSATATAETAEAPEAAPEMPAEGLEECVMNPDEKAMDPEFEQEEIS